MAAVEAYVANLFWLNTGKAGTEPLALPTDYDTAQALFRRLGVADGEHDMVITETHSTIPGLDRCLSPYENLEEVNYLAALLDKLDEDELTKFAAALEHGEYSEVQDLINLTQNLGCYDFYPEIVSTEDLGRRRAEGKVTLAEDCRFYFDYAAYGEDTAINEGGAFTKGGYIHNNHSEFVEHYNGRDIPEEHRIFARPAPREQARPATIPETLATLQTAIKQADTQTDRPRPAAHER